MPHGRVRSSRTHAQRVQEILFRVHTYDFTCFELSKPDGRLTLEPLVLAFSPKGFSQFLADDFADVVKQSATFALMDLSNSGMSEMFIHRPYKEGRISDASRQYNGPV